MNCKQTLSYVLLLVLFSSLAFVFLSHAQANGITRVQGNYKGASTAVNVTVTLGSTPISGNVLIATIGIANSATVPTVSTVKDGNLHVTWTLQIRRTYLDTGSYVDNEIWFGIVAASASVTQNVTLTGASAQGAVVNICEYSGLATSNFLDKTAYLSLTSSTTGTGTTTTTSNASQLWVGSTTLYTGSGNQNTPTNSFSLLDGVCSTHCSNAFLERIATSASNAWSNTTDSGGTDNWVGCIATFKPTPINSYSFVFAETPKAISTEANSYSRTFLLPQVLRDVTTETNRYSLTFKFSQQLRSITTESGRYALRFLFSNVLTGQTSNIVSRITIFLFSDVGHGNVFEGLNYALHFTFAEGLTGLANKNVPPTAGLLGFFAEILRCRSDVTFYYPDISLINPLGFLFGDGALFGFLLIVVVLVIIQALSPLSCVITTPLSILIALMYFKRFTDYPPPQSNEFLIWFGVFMVLFAVLLIIFRRKK